MRIERVRSIVIVSVMALATGALGVGGGASAAQAGTTYVIDSVAGCQQFLDDFVGPPPAGTVSPGRCVVAGSEHGPGEVHLPPGDRLVIGAGWELFFDSVLFFNEGVTINNGSLRSRDDVVNLVGGSLLVNRGTITIVRGSSLNVMDDAVVVNRGRIVLACGGGSYGPVTGAQPLPIDACDEAPWVDSSSPAPGARGVPVTASVVVRFSERVTWSPGWADLRCSASGGHRSVTRSGPGTSLVLDPVRDLRPGEWCRLTVHGGGITDAGVDLPDLMDGDHQIAFRTCRGSRP